MELTPQRLASKDLYLTALHCSSCLEIAQQCVDKGMHSPVLVEEMAKLLETLSWDLEHGRVRTDDLVPFQKRLRILGPALCAVRSRNFDPQRFNEAWKRLFPEAIPALSQDELELVSRGYVAVAVERIPAESLKFPSFLFCRSGDGEMFFCHRSSLSDTDLSVWNDLHVGDRAFILPSEQPTTEEGRFRNALSTVILGE